jgi:hypothetical protein
MTFDVDAWSSVLVTNLGKFWNREVEVSVCQHFSSLTGCHVLEAAVVHGLEASDEASARRTVVQISNAVLEVSPPKQLSAKVAKPVSVCGVHDAKWFVDSLHAANRCALETATGNTWTWDPELRRVVREPLMEYVFDEGWCLLHGWLAHAREATEVKHPRALHAEHESRRLWALISRIA